MAKILQLLPFLLARSAGLWLLGRVHFPRNRIGEVVREQEDFVIFRQVVVDPAGDQPERPGAIFKVRFHFARFSAKMNKILSLIPIPFIIAQPGFRSKTWMMGQKIGAFQGFYEWDSIEDAEDYSTSFPMKLMKRRAVPETLNHEVRKTTG